MLYLIVEEKNASEYGSLAMFAYKNPNSNIGGSEVEQLGIRVVKNVEDSRKAIHIKFFRGLYHFLIEFFSKMSNKKLTPSSMLAYMRVLRRCAH